MHFDITPDEMARAVSDCAERLLWEAEIHVPPVDALLVARRLGIVVVCGKLPKHRARYLRLPTSSRSCMRDTIVFADDRRPERRQWAVAHEIGEYASHLIFQALGMPAGLISGDSREEAANRLASSLLLPPRWFSADGQAASWDLVALKQRYATASHELVARRMLDMETPVVVTVCDQGRVRWRSSNAARHAPPLCLAERDAWRIAHRQGRYCTSPVDPLMCGLQRVECWPVHEPGWRREILRSEIFE